MEVLLLIHLAATLFMTGLIWWVQIVHYPLFGEVPAEAFEAYEREHIRRAGWVVSLPMAVELFSGIGLLLNSNLLQSVMFWIALILLAVIWLFTAFVQVRQHQKLRAGFNRDLHRSLVRWNWVRTVAWTVRAGLLLWVVMSMTPILPTGGF